MYLILCVGGGDGPVTCHQGGLWESQREDPKGIQNATLELRLQILCLKGQKISPDGKAKIQLQLVLHTGDSTTFHFANESSALKDREATKELLQQLLPKFKKKANKELEEKNR